MIIPVWKPLGASTHQLAKTIGERVSQITLNPEDKKATHTGTLDPMAEGVVIVLTGEDRYNKKKYSDTKKTYVFEILVGIKTDSHDTLGLQQQVIQTEIELSELEKKIKKILPNFIGNQAQQQPLFSAQRVHGNSAFSLAKQGQKFHQKTNNITIYSIELLSNKLMPKEEIKSRIFSNVSTVHGNFRQKKIVSNWEKTFLNLEKNNVKNLPVFQLQTTVSKRTYIRALTRDLSHVLSIPATTLHITRTANGVYQERDCISLQPTKFQKQIQTLQNQDVS